MCSQKINKTRNVFLLENYSECKQARKETTTVYFKFQRNTLKYFQFVKFNFLKINNIFFISILSTIYIKFNLITIIKRRMILLVKKSIYDSTHVHTYVKKSRDIDRYFFHFLIHQKKNTH